MQMDVGSNQLRESPQARHRLSHTLRGKGGEILLHILGRVLEAGPVSFGCGADDMRCQVELIDQEVVGMPDLDPIGLQGCSRKILQVERHDEVGPCADGRSQNMPIVRVRQCDGIDERLVTCNKAIPDMSIHQVSGSLKLFRLQVRAIFENVPHPLIMNGIGPFRAVKICHREMHEQIAEWSRIEDTRVV